MGQFIRKIKRRIRNLQVFRIFHIYREKVLSGFESYKRAIRGRGENAVLFLTSTSYGDMYIFGRMLNIYAQKYYGEMAPVFAVSREPGRKLGEILNINNIEVFTPDEMMTLYNLLMFGGHCNIHLDGLHHHMAYRHTEILSFLEGFHECNYLEYIEACLGIEPSEILAKPRFDPDLSFVEQDTNKGLFVPGRTVLLVPYAGGMRLPDDFWQQLTGELQRQGISVYTNVRNDGGELPVNGSTAIYVPFDKVVPFIEYAGAVVGLRCGLLDIVSEAKCLKISICPKNARRRSVLYPMYKFFSLSDMYKVDDQYDFAYTPENASIIIRQITELLRQNHHTDI